MRKKDFAMNDIFEIEIMHRIVWVISLVVAEYVLVLAAVGGDLVSGVRKARRRGEATRSRALRRTVDKIARYYNVLAVLTVVDAMQLTAVFYLRVVEGYDVPTVPVFTLVGSLGMAAVEVKSIFEKGDQKEKRQLAEIAELLENLTGNEHVKQIFEILKNAKK